MATESLLHQKQVTEAKLVKVTNFLENSAKPDEEGNFEWQTERLQKGVSRATAYNLGKDLRESNFLQWAKNAARVAQMNLALRGTVLPRLKDEVEDIYCDIMATIPFGYAIKPEVPLMNFGDLKEHPILNNYLQFDCTREQKDIIVPFLDSQGARRILTELYIPRSNVPRDVQHLGNRVAGAAWEELGFHEFREVVERRGQHLLSPDATFALYRALYPELATTLRDNRLNPGLTRQTFPDGLIIQRRDDYLSIEGIVDYKAWRHLNGHGEELRTQIVNFQHEQLAVDLNLEGSRAINSLYHSNLLHILNPYIPGNIPLKVNHEITKDGDNEVPVYKVFIVTPKGSDIFVPGAKYISSSFIDGRDLSKLVDVLYNYVDNIRPNFK